jgi:hypothetical protein
LAAGGEDEPDPSPEEQDVTTLPARSTVTPTAAAALHLMAAT